MPRIPDAFRPLDLGRAATLDDDAVDVGNIAQDVDRREPLAAKVVLAGGGHQPLEVALDDRHRHDSFHPRGIAAMDDIRRQGKDNGDRRDTGETGAGKEGLSSVRLDIRGIDDDQSPGGEATNELAMEDRERGPRPALVRLIAVEKRAERVGG